MYPAKPTSLFRYVSAVLLFVLLLFPLLSLTAQALTPYSYNMSKDYKNSVYYENLTSLSLTGNGAADVLMVAMSQLGYHEGNSDADFGGANTAGSKNFVEYNRLYGKLDNKEGNGYSYGYAWCAAFVNWCLRQAGVPKSIAGGEVSCTRWIRDFLKPNGIWQASAAHGGTYIPKAGDLIFFKKDGSSALSTHVGLVRYVDGTYVHTVEGNTASGAVALDAYPLDSTYVIGYGTPDYETNGRSVCDYKGSGKIAGLYIVTADALNVRAEPNAAAKRIGGLTKAQLVTVKSFTSGFAKIELGNGTEGYTSLYYLELVTVPPPPRYTVTFLDRDGTTVLSALECEENTLPTAPAVPSFVEDGVTYAFVGWSSELAPVTAHTVYTAVYQRAKAPEESLPPADSETAGVTDTAPPETDVAEPPEGSGCHGVISTAVLLPLLLPVPVLALRKRRK